MIYDAGRENVFHCQHFYLKQVLNLENDWRIFSEPQKKNNNNN